MNRPTAERTGGEAADSTTDDKPLLVNRAFLALWSGQSISQIGSAITVLALPLLAINVLNARPGEIGLLQAAFSVSAIVAALPGGVIVDRISKRRTMAVCDLVRGVSLASVPVFAALHLLTMPQLYLVAFINGLFTLVFGLAYHAYIPVVAPRRHLKEANSKIAATESFARVSGPGLAGLLVSLVGAATTIVADVATYLFSVLTLFFTPADRPDQDSQVERVPMLRSAREGFAVVVANRILTATAITTIGAMFALAMINAVFVYFMVRELSLSTALVGVIMAVGEAGGLAAAVFAPKIMRFVGSARVMWVAALLSPAGFLVAPATHGSALILIPAFMLISSCRFVIFDIAQYTYRQMVCPPAAFGRMTASIRFGISVAMAIGAGVGGLLGNAFGGRATMVIATAVMCFASVPVLLSGMHKTRDMEDLPDMPAEKPAEKPMSDSSVE